MPSRRRSSEPRRCLVAGCGAAVPSWKRLCDGCWRLLPFATPKAVAEAGGAKAAHIVQRLCLAAAAELAAGAATRAAAAGAQAARMIGEKVE